MNIHDKFEMEKRIFDRLIEFHRKNAGPHSHVAILAYEHGRQVCEELYQMSQQKEKTEEVPF